MPKIYGSGFGLYINKPRDNSPDFIQGSLSIKIDTLVEKLSELKAVANSMGYAKFDVFLSKDLDKKTGQQEWYLALNTYNGEKKEAPRNKINPDDIPF